MTKKVSNYFKTYIVLSLVSGVIFSFLLLPKLAMTFESEVFTFLVNAINKYGLAVGVAQAAAIVPITWFAHRPSIRPRWERFLSTQNRRLIDILKIGIVFLIISSLIFLSLSLYLYIK